MHDLIHPLALRAVRAIHALKSPPPTGSQHYRSGYDDGLEAAMDAVKDAVPAPSRGLPTIITPPTTMPPAVIAMLQVTIDGAWERYDGVPTQAEEFWNFLVGNGAANVPRETSTPDDGDTHE